MASSEVEFFHFSKLPTELRLQIWALAIPNRVLPIICTKGILSPSTHRYVQRFSTTSPPPALLLACRESRSIALTIYSSFFRTKSSPQGIYASFAHDTVSLCEGTVNYLGNEELEGIERLVLGVKDHAYFGYFNLGYLRGMSSLKMLVLRAENTVRYSWETRDDAVSDIFRDFRSEVLEWPDWKVPDEIRIVHAGTGQELCVIRGREDLLKMEEE
jgi:hypothetical protein